MAEYEYDGTLEKAFQHLKDARDAIDDSPDPDTDFEEHSRCIRLMHAHVKSCDSYLESYRRSIDVDNHDVDTGDPEDEDEKAARRRRARQLRGAM
jgi:hypothetical protein